MLYEVNASGTDLSNSIIVIRFLLNGGFAGNLASGAGVLRLEDTSGNQSDFYVAGSDTYPGGWQIVVIDTSLTESANNGTAATMTAIRYAGMVVNANGASGGDDNFYIDEVLSCPNTGLTLGGNTTNVFDETATWDETSLYGVVERRAGAVFSKVPLILAPDASDHASSDEILFFEELIYEDGTNIDAAVSDLGLSSSDADNNDLTRLTCVCEDNGDITGTHATKTIDFSSATDTDLTDCTFTGFNATTSAIQLGGSGNAINGCTFNLCGQVSAGAAPFRDCIFRNTTDASGAFFWDENTDMEDCAFFSDGTGYGIRYRPTGAGPFTETFDGMTFTGYGSDETADAAVHINPVTTTVTITINVTNGLTPTTDEDAGYTGTFTIQQSVTVTVTVKDPDNANLEGATVYLKTTGGTVVLNGLSNASGVVTASYSGSLPATIDTAESWVRYGSRATPLDQFTLSGTITTSGYSATALMQPG